MNESVHVRNQTPCYKLNPESTEGKYQDKVITIISKEEKAVCYRIVFLNSHNSKIGDFIIFI